jgi:hypothetical protein
LRRRHRRVPAPLPAPRGPRRLRPHPPLRAARQPPPDGRSGAVPRALGSTAAAGRAAGVRPRPLASRHRRRHRTLSRLPAGRVAPDRGPRPRRLGHLVSGAGRPPWPRPPVASAASRPRARSRSARSTPATPGPARVCPASLAPPTIESPYLMHPRGLVQLALSAMRGAQRIKA